MSVEQEKIPGYDWHHFENFDLYIPVPNNWIVNPPVSGDYVMKLTMAEKILNKDGYYRTGLAMSAIKQFEKQEKIQGVWFARNRLEMMPRFAPHDKLEIRESEDDPLIFSMRPFISREMFLDFRISENITEHVVVPISLCYFMVAYNKQTGTGYSARFITPMIEMDESESVEVNNERFEIGRNMIANIRLSKKV